jgi:hypothetical protein
MPIRKCLVLALGLALALAALAPASALAKEGGTNRPLKGTMSGTSEGSILTGKVTADETGEATHLGEFTFHADSYITGFVPPNILYNSGTWSLVVANGGRLEGTFTATSTESGPAPGEFTGHEATFDAVINGGTGRFADASGTMTGTEVGTVISRDEDGTAHDAIEDTFTGQISY